MSAGRSHALTRRQLLKYAAGLTLARAGRARAAWPPAVGRGTMHFDRERFVSDCVAASRERDGQAAVREVLTRAVSEPDSVLTGLGVPREAGLDVLHRSSTLTIFAAHWAPRMSLPTHDHRLWALIGLYTGREDNILWRRAARRVGVEAYGAKVLFAGDVAALPADAVHSVTNPLARFTGGLHIYGGDFFATARSQWDAESLAEEPSDGGKIRALFERENERLKRETCPPN